MDDLNEYATGDDITLDFRITKNGDPLKDGIPGATVVVALLKQDRSGVAAGTGDVAATITDPVACAGTVTFPRATTGSIVPGIYRPSFQVTMNNDVRTYPGDEIRIVNGARPV